VTETIANVASNPSAAVLFGVAHRVKNHKRFCSNELMFLADAKNLA